MKMFSPLCGAGQASGQLTLAVLCALVAFLNPDLYSDNEARP